MISKKFNTPHSKKRAACPLLVVTITSYRSIFFWHWRKKPPQKGNILRPASDELLVAEADLRGCVFFAKTENN